jgi:predicted metal-binding membrane protein
MRLESPIRTAAGPGATTAVTAGTLTGTLVLAAACWIIAVWQMHGMNMGTATQLGPFGAFIAVWVAMMAAMMLPGAAPALLRRAQAAGLRAVPWFAGSYLAVWALAGVAVYAVDRPHGALAAGAVTVAAGVYEFTPVKKQFRERCRAGTRSGFGFGLCCAGSTVGLMAMLAALGAMSITWMAVITVLACAQKLLPPKAAIDMPLALAIIGLGAWIVIAPASVPGLMPSM